VDGRRVDCGGEVVPLERLGVAAQLEALARGAASGNAERYYREALELLAEEVVP
jgi:hypothetical protein